MLRRYRWRFATLALFLLLLTGFAVAMQQQLRHTDAEAVKARRIADFMIETFSRGVPSGLKGGQIPLEDLLPPAVAQLERDFADQPRLRLELARHLSTVVSNLGDWREAEGILDRQLKAVEPHFREADSQWTWTLRERGVMRIVTGSLETGREDLQAALALQRALGHRGGEVARTLQWLGSYYRRTGSTDEAITHLHEAWEEIQAWDVEEEPRHSHIWFEMGLAYNIRGWLIQGEAAFRRARIIADRTRPEGHPDTGMVRLVLATNLSNQQRWEEAEALQERAEEIHANALPADHPTLLLCRTNLAFLAGYRGDFSTAEEGLLSVLKYQREREPAGSTARFRTFYTLTELYRRMERWESAEAYGQEGLREARLLPNNVDGRWERTRRGSLLLDRLARRIRHSGFRVQELNDLAATRGL